MAYTKDISSIGKLKTRFRHGLFMQSVRYKLVDLGIEITPYYLFLEDLNFIKMPKIKGAIEEYTFVPLGSDDMKTIAAFPRTGWTEEKLLALLQAGEKCVGIKYKGEIAAFMWIYPREFSYKSTVMKLKGNEAYLTDMYTVEKFRGRNIAPYLRYRCYEFLKEMGRHLLYSITTCFNSPALKFKQKVNARKIKLILYIQLFNRFHWSFTLRSYKNP